MMFSISGISTRWTALTPVLLAVAIMLSAGPASAFHQNYHTQNPEARRFFTDYVDREVLPLAEERAILVAEYLREQAVANYLSNLNNAACSSPPRALNCAGQRSDAVTHLDSGRREVSSYCINLEDQAVSMALFANQPRGATSPRYPGWTRDQMTALLSGRVRTYCEGLVRRYIREVVNPGADMIQEACTADNAQLAGIAAQCR